MTTNSHLASQDLQRMAYAAGTLGADERLDLAGYGIVDRDSYLAFVAAWKQEWHARVAEVRAAKAGMRRKGAAHGDARALDQERREALRQRLNALHGLRRAAKAASVDRRRRSIAVAAE